MTPRSVLARHATGLSPAPLPGGTANRGLVVRVGDTVRRPTAPCWPATHALLAHLSKVGFDGAPRVLAAGPATETLTYIDGQAAARVTFKGVEVEKGQELKIVGHPDGNEPAPVDYVVFLPEGVLD